MTGLDHDDLLSAFQAGNETAFEQVYKMNYQALRVQAFLLLNNKEDAEDQVQQLFLDIWNRQLYKNVRESLKSYLHTAIRNRCLNFLQKAGKIHAEKEKYGKELVHYETEKYEEPVMNTQFTLALKELPLQRSRAFQLVCLEDKKYMQAAEEMGISINSLKSHLKLAVKFLRMRIER